MKKYLKVLLCFCLSFVLLYSSVIFYGNAVEVNPYNTKIDYDLVERLNQIDDDEKICVSIWLTDIDHELERQKIEEALNKKIEANELPKESLQLLSLSLDDKLDYNLIDDVSKLDNCISTEETQLIISTKRSVSKELYANENSKKINHLFTCSQIREDLHFVSHYSPTVVIELTKHNILSLNNDEQIESIYYYDLENSIINGTDELSFETQQNNNLDSLYNFSTYQYEMTGIDYLRDELGYTGEGIKIGMIDFPFANASTIDYFSDDTIQEYHCATGSIINEYTSHGNRCACIIAGNYYNETTGDSFLGAVPDAELYLTAGFYYREALEWLLDQGVNLINSSLIFGNDAINSYGDTAKWIDHIVSQHNVHYICGAGNNEFGAGIQSGFFGYNSITVGNVNQDGVISSNSSYNSNETSFKPDLAAPGTSFILPANRNNPDGVPVSHSGTSYAAPVVSGAVAQLCQASSVLAANPRLMKAVLLSGSTINSNMYSGGTNTMLSTLNSADNKFHRQYGSGVLNVLNSYNDSVLNGYSFSGYIPNFVNSIQSSKTVSVSEGDLIRVSAVWDKITTVSNSHESGTVQTPSFDTYLLTVNTPDNDNYRALYYYDTKEIVSFIAPSSGTYTISLLRMYNSSNAVTSFGASLSVQSN